MGTGYTRNDTANNIADGNVINAADFDGEYDAIEAAFNSSTGHTHDGTSAEGAPITVLGPSQEFVASSSEVKPSTNAGLDLGTSALKFKDLYLDGTAYIDGLGGNLLVDTTNALQFRDAQLSINSSADGQLDIAADTTAKITSPEVIVTDDFRLQSDAAILTFGADNDVTVTHVADTGLDAKAASGFVLKLQTGDTTVESGNTVGKISFNAPDEAGGTDAILVGAEIEAAAEATFSSTDNSTALVFKTNTSAAATERMRIKSDGDIVTQGANYTMTWDHSADALTFVDNAKIILGTGSDLEIYHDSLNSVIKDAGTGNLVIAADDFRLQNSSQTANMISANDDGAVTLTYNGGNRIATTDEGVDVTGDISVGNLNLITNTISSTDTNGDINLSPNGTGTVVINTDLDVDNININGNSITSTDTNGDINITPNGTGKVNIAGGFVPSEINLTSTDAGATEGPVFELHRNSASPADNDLIGAIDFAGQDDGGNKVTYAKLYSKILDVTDGTEDGFFAINTFQNGSQVERMRTNATETIFNEGGNDLDFRVESSGNQHMIYVDAGNNHVNIGTSTDLGGVFNVSGSTHPILNVQSSSDGTLAKFVCTDADANVGPVLELYRNSGSPADNDLIGAITFFGENDADSNIEYAKIRTQMLDVTSGTEDAKFVIQTRVAGAGRERLMLTNTETNFNDDGYDIDFRIEGDGDNNLFYVDASQDRVYVGTNSNVENAKLGVSGGKSISAGIPQGGLGVTDTTAMAQGVGGGITLNGQYKTDGTYTSFAGIEAEKVNGTTNNYDGKLVLKARKHGSSNISRLELSQSEAVFNQDSEDTNFRIESDANSNLFFVDAGFDSGQGAVGIGTSSPQRGSGFGGSQSVLHITGCTVPEVRIQSSTAGQGDLSIYASNSGAQAYIDNENGNLLLGRGGNNILVLGNSVIFNEDSDDADFRIESNNNANIFKVDAGEDRVLIGTSGVLGKFTGAPLQVSSFGIRSMGVSSSATDTGISVNAGSTGMGMLVLASRNTSNGTATASALYLINFYHDGNHTPAVSHISGTNFITFSKSGSNTLTMANASGGNCIATMLMSG